MGTVESIGVASARKFPATDCREKLSRQDSAEPLWFALLCRELCGPNAPKELASAPASLMRTNTALVLRRRPISSALCFRSATNPNTQRGVWYVPQGPQRKACRHSGADRRSLAELSSRLTQFTTQGRQLRQGFH